MTVKIADCDHTACVPGLVHGMSLWCSHVASVAFERHLKGTLMCRA